jgi:hypothetical protein
MFVPGHTNQGLCQINHANWRYYASCRVITGPHAMDASPEDQTRVEAGADVFAIASVTRHRNIQTLTACVRRKDTFKGHPGERFLRR